MELNLIRLASVDTIVAGIKGNYDIVLDPIWNEIGQAMQLIASENNRHFATTPLVFPRNDAWETRVEIPYRWRVTAQIWVVLLIGLATWKICFSQSQALPRSGLWRFISMEFLRVSLSRHFAGKIVGLWRRRKSAVFSHYPIVHVF